MGNVIQDLRYGVRALLQSPGFTILTVLTLGLAIGVNTAIFSMINVILLKPLPIDEKLLFIYSALPQRGIDRAYVSRADFLDFRRELRSFDELAGVNRGVSLVLSGVDEPARVIGFEATANAFELWGLQPLLGRGFVAGEDAPGAERVAVLSHGGWQRRFGGDPGVLGRTIELDGHETTIVGVLGPEIEFGSLALAELWIPLRIDPSSAPRTGTDIWTAGRLRPGVTFEEVYQEVAAAGAELASRHPETNAGVQYRVLTINQVLAPDNTWLMFYMLTLTVTIVMLIACSNIATMMLARATARSKEIAVRSALGAGRFRILRQLLTESLTIAVVSGLTGLLVARLSLEGLVWMVGDSTDSNFFSLLAIDRNVLLFTLGASFVAPLLFGFVPAWRASRADLQEALKDGSRGTGGGVGLRSRRVLVATQVAMALSLMVIAGILIRDMMNTRSLDLGIETDGRLTARIDLPDGKYPEEHQWLPFFEQAMARFGGLSSIERAAWVSSRPYADGLPPQVSLTIEGDPMPEAERAPWARLVVAGVGFFDVAGIPVLSGRAFVEADDQDAIPVAVINEDMAERYWPNEDPLSQRISVDLPGSDRGPVARTEENDGPWLQIVGVVGNLATGNPDNPTAPFMYLPLRQQPSRGMGLVLRTRGDPAAAGAGVREQIWALDPDQPVGDVRTVEQIIADALAMDQAFDTIFVCFAGFALIMATTGIFGVISFSVARRTREIGIRVALGAEGTDVVSMVVRQALKLVGLGVMVGAVAAYALGQVVASAVQTVSATDPLMLAGVALALGVAALIATWVPARRALRIDPIIALRQD